MRLPSIEASCNGAASIEAMNAFPTTRAQRWQRRGLIYAPDGLVPWAQQHGFPPTPVERPDGSLRLYLSFTDEHVVGRMGWIDVDPDDPARVVGVSEVPVLDIGQPGTFDENGVVATHVIAMGDELWMYYVGYQLGQKVRYYQFLGLAISRDGGETFERVQRVPVIDRSDAELVNRTSGFVLPEDGVFKLWYTAGSTWTEVDGKPLPIYGLKYLESPDGISFGPEGEPAVELDEPDEHALGRPWVLREPGGYRMWFSSRTRSRGYRIGYAESADGRSWTRRDNEIQFDVAEDGWDSGMVAYAAIWQRGERTIMFYNGNDCGRTGVGWAELDGPLPPLAV